MYIGHACLSVCLSDCGHMPTILNGPRCNMGEMVGVPPSYALLGGFAFGVWDELHCYDKIVRARNVSECLYSLCALLC